LIKRLTTNIKKLFGIKSSAPPAPQTHNEPRRHKGQQAPLKSDATEKNRRHSKQSGNNHKQHQGQQRKPKKRQSKKPQGPAKYQKKVIPKKPDSLIAVPDEAGKVKFNDLPIHQDILFGLQDIEFKYCTPIQASALPVLLEKHDLTGKAQTGTGKTAAFLIGMIHHIINNPLENRTPGSCRALVLAPTRELAIQIHKDAEALCKYTNLNNLVIFGGMDHKGQRDRLNEPIDILIGTPGRIIDYSSSRHLNLGKAEFLVLDEADRMLDMGFIPDVRRIVSRLPKPEKRQTMLFSATFDEKIMRLVRNWMVDPVAQEMEPETVVTDLIEQTFYTISRDEKLPLLIWLINHEKVERMLVFGNRKDMNDRLAKNLTAYGVECRQLSGDVPQDKRIKILERFRNGDIKVVIATDVAARGIHVDGISHVINYDLPERSEDYVHRIGRTGRAGETGKAISFACEYGAYALGAIEEYIGHEVKCIQPEEEMVIMPPRPKNPPKQQPSYSNQRNNNSRSGNRNNSRSGNRNNSRNRNSGR
jgi:ATP-dependent RNA helicase RhlB